MITDIRLALRRLRAGPMFAVGVIGTLALGIAAATSMYTVIDGILLKPLPFMEPDRLVRLGADFTGRGLRDVGLSQPELEDFARRSGAFASVAGVWSITANLVGADRPERVEVLLASADYFALLGARAAVGRTFTQADEQPGIAAPIVISDEFWRRAFGASPTVLGRTLRIDDDPYEVVGVMPAGFRHPETGTNCVPGYRPWMVRALDGTEVASARSTCGWSSWANPITRLGSPANDTAHAAYCPVSLTTCSMRVT